MADLVNSKALDVRGREELEAGDGTVVPGVHDEEKRGEVKWESDGE